EFGGRLSEGAVAYPPDRVWGGIPTMAGQMPLLPMACLFPGDPERTYLKTWELNILDTGIGMDFTSALVAGLAQALVVEEDWDEVFQSMLNTDPYAYNEVPWVERRFKRWLGRALEIGRGDYESTAVFFSELENRMEAETWWEAHVPMTITFAILEYADYNPIAAMQLSLEFGRDTDSTAQLMGAFLGAVYGLEIWSEEIREPVERELNVQYGVTVEDLLEVFSGE
ncbi:MAG: ADP-ribosylglycohydrolase family protein, partial [Verrucomicrobiota bacterium]